ncbi:MAG TPA: hypothetical protein VK206_08460 [Anaerolineales bacterium]|nr:hypothetical protein [Anaerolineales bacterium]
MITFKSINTTRVVLAFSILWLVTACTLQVSTLSDKDIVPHLAELVNAVSSGSAEDLLALVQFSSLPCTKKEGLGGPPKCLATETEGTRIDVLPILGPEGGHIRRSEFSSWFGSLTGVGAPQLYAAFRTSKSTYSDEFFPAGEFGVAFLLPDKANVVVFRVTDAGIVRVDYPALPSYEDILKDNKVILGPYPPPK